MQRVKLQNLPLLLSFIIDPIKRLSLKYEAASPLCFLNYTRAKLAIIFSLEEKTVKNYLYLSKLAAQMVTSTPSENLSLQL
jgi:hypothetical protein